MHKSRTTTTFVLLASSLVMLSAMPLFNTNNVAMAQGYSNYYGDSSYSQYPTEDKKYECQTGPFEGFFVSSVEFCKHVKFDDSIINNNNVIGAGGESSAHPEEPITPPTGEKPTTLQVISTVSCYPIPDSSPEAVQICQRIETAASSGFIPVTVTGNNPNPSEFDGSESGTIVTLDAGDYEVKVGLVLLSPPGETNIIRTTDFFLDCTNINPRDPLSTEATGTIEAGESKTCLISNEFHVFSTNFIIAP